MAELTVNCPIHHPLRNELPPGGSFTHCHGYASNDPVFHRASSLLSEGHCPNCKVRLVRLDNGWVRCLPQSIDWKLTADCNECPPPLEPAIWWVRSEQHDGARVVEALVEAWMPVRPEGPRLGDEPIAVIDEVHVMKSDDLITLNEILRRKK